MTRCRQYACQLRSSWITFLGQVTLEDPVTLHEEDACRHQQVTEQTPVHEAFVALAMDKEKHIEEGEITSIVVIR